MCGHYPGPTERKLKGNGSSKTSSGGTCRRWVRWGGGREGGLPRKTLVTPLNIFCPGQDTTSPTNKLAFHLLPPAGVQHQRLAGPATCQALLYLEVPQSTSKYLKVPRSTSMYLKVPISYPSTGVEHQRLAAGLLRAAAVSFVLQYFPSCSFSSPPPTNRRRRIIGSEHGHRGHCLSMDTIDTMDTF